MSRKSKKKGPKGKRAHAARHTPLTKHTRKGSELRGPLSDLTVKPIGWTRDLLPEHLWLAGLADLYGVDDAHHPFNEFMDLIDEFIDDKQGAYGLISDFGLVDESRRDEFLTQHTGAVQKLFINPIGRILSFYPDNPAAWLLREDLIQEGGSLSPEFELGRLRRLVTDLYDGRDQPAGHLRCVPLNRILKHGNLLFSERVEVTKLLPKYPTGCTEEEKAHVQSSVRAMTNMLYGEKPSLTGRAWPSYFWRHNLDLEACRPQRMFAIQGSRVEADAEDALVATCAANANLAVEYVDALALSIPYDLYSPEKGEVFFGLLSRVIRLYSLIMADTNLWQRDTGGIMVRCLADTAITFGYLAKAATEEEVSTFIRYGEGQEKLLMLHLQDTHPGALGLDGRTADEISDELGGFHTELLNIELGNWSKKDTRKMALAAGMEKLYRLIYSPASSEVHGEWGSLKHATLCYCTEPLHRLHRMPVFTHAPMNAHLLVAAQVILEVCLEIGVDKLGYPKMAEQLAPLDPILQATPQPEKNEDEVAEEDADGA
ncbi:MAG: hypothetical protein JW990_06760 [Thermoleophilia bacterium]|nr:hypothetical protein [Thermoleophilia bacterium]